MLGTNTNETRSDLRTRPWQASVGGLYGVLIWGALYDATAVGFEAEKPMAYIFLLYFVATVRFCRLRLRKTVLFCPFIYIHE